MLLQYVKVGQGGPPEAREIVKARGRHVSGGGKKASSSSSNVGYLMCRGLGLGSIAGSAMRNWRHCGRGPLIQSRSFHWINTRRAASLKIRVISVPLRRSTIDMAQRRARGLYVPSVFAERLERYLATMTRSATRRKQKDRRREARAAAKEPIVDLVSECSGREDDDGGGFSVASGGGSKRKRRETCSEGARSKPRGTKARKVDVDMDSDDVPRYLHPDRVGRPLADYAPGYDMVANKIQKDAMRAIGTVWGPEGRLQCLGSAAIFFEGRPHYGIRL